MAGDLTQQKREELKRKLLNSQSDYKDANSKPKKFKWGQLFLGLIGLIIGIVLLVNSI
mgnify:CR=1 FL=1